MTDCISANCILSVKEGGLGFPSLVDSRIIGDSVLILVGTGKDRAVMVFFAVDCGGWRKDIGEIIGWH